MAPFREHLKALFLAIFIMLFILQSYNQIESFIAQDTGTSKTWLSTFTFQFPAISVCFGFDQLKPMVLTGSHEYDMMFTYFNWYPNAGEPLTEKDIQNWWDNVTVDPKTTLDSIKLYLNQDASNHVTYQVGNEDIENEDVSIVKGNYHQGKCITIKLKKPVVYDNYVAFQPKEGIDKVIKFYLHSHGSELGLNRHFWPFLPTIVHANLNELSEIILGQIIVTNEPTRYRKCNSDPSYSYEKCIFAKLSESGFSNVSALQDNSETECSNQTFCKLPYTEKYMSKSIPFCTTMLASRCNALFFGNQILEKQVKGSSIGCQKPCSRTKWTAEQSDYYRSSGEGSPKGVFFYFSSQDYIEVEKEYLICSFPDLVSSLGGSLGLFLGFSCYAFSTDIINKYLK